MQGYYGENRREYPPRIYGWMKTGPAGRFELLTYPANLCPLFGWAELAGFGEDFGQPIGKAVEAASRRAVRQGSTEHLDCVLREEQRVNNAVYASATMPPCGCRSQARFPFPIEGSSKTLSPGLHRHKDWPRRFSSCVR